MELTFIKLSFQVGKPCGLHADMRRVITKSKRRARVKLGEIHIIIVADLVTDEFFRQVHWWLNFSPMKSSEQSYITSLVTQNV